MNNKIEFNYRYSSKNEDKTQQIMDIFLESDYGAMISYEEVNEVLMINLDDEDELKYMKNFVGKLKNALIDRGRVIQSVRNQGWYILKPQHIASYTYRNYIVKPQKAYKKADRILQRYDKRPLNEERIREYTDINNLNHKLQDFSENLINNSDYMKNRNKYNELKD